MKEEKITYQKPKQQISHLKLEIFNYKDDKYTHWQIGNSIIYAYKILSHDLKCQNNSTQNNFAIYQRLHQDLANNLISQTDKSKNILQNTYFSFLLNRYFSESLQISIWNMELIHRLINHNTTPKLFISHRKISIHGLSQAILGALLYFLVKEQIKKEQKIVFGKILVLRLGMKDMTINRQVFCELSKGNVIVININIGQQQKNYHSQNYFTFYLSNFDNQFIALLQEYIVPILQRQFIAAAIIQTDIRCLYQHSLPIFISPKNISKMAFILGMKLNDKIIFCTQDSLIYNQINDQSRQQLIEMFNKGIQTYDFELVCCEQIKKYKQKVQPLNIQKRQLLRKNLSNFILVLTNHYSLQDLQHQLSFPYQKILFNLNKFSKQKQKQLVNLKSNLIEIKTIYNTKGDPFKNNLLKSEIKQDILNFKSINMNQDIRQIKYVLEYFKLFKSQILTTQTHFIYKQKQTRILYFVQVSSCGWTILKHNFTKNIICIFKIFSDCPNKVIYNASYSIMDQQLVMLNGLIKGQILNDYVCTLNQKGCFWNKKTKISQKQKGLLKFNASSASMNNKYIFCIGGNRTRFQESYFFTFFDFKENRITPLSKVLLGKDKSFRRKNIQAQSCQLFMISNDNIMLYIGYGGRQFYRLHRNKLIVGIYPPKSNGFQFLEQLKIQNKYQSIFRSLGMFQLGFSNNNSAYIGLINVQQIAHQSLFQKKQCTLVKWILIVKVEINKIEINTVSQIQKLFKLFVKQKEWKLTSRDSHFSVILQLYKI